jgi:hypothetical protein
MKGIFVIVYFSENENFAPNNYFLKVAARPQSTLGIKGKNISTILNSQFLEKTWLRSSLETIAINLSLLLLLKG